MLLIQFIVLLLGLYLVVKGADILISSAISLGKKYNLSELVIGIVIIGFGTSLSELFVSIEAVVNEAPDLSIGNVIGSNIANLLLILGFCGFFKNITVNKIPKFDNIFHLSIHLFFFFIFWFSRFNYIFGAIFILLFFLYLISNFKGAKRKGVEEIEIESNFLSRISYEKPLMYGLPITILSILVTLVGADLTVESSIKISEYYGITDSFLGLTVISIGTSLPEVATGIAAIKRGRTNLIIGNIIGSNIYNLLLILGLASFFGFFSYNKVELFSEVLFLFICIFIFFIFSQRKLVINKWISFILLSVYSLYLINLYSKNFF